MSMQKVKFIFLNEALVAVDQNVYGINLHYAHFIYPLN